MSSLVGREGHFAMGAGGHGNHNSTSGETFAACFQRYALPAMLVFSFYRACTWRGENL